MPVLFQFICVIALLSVIRHRSCLIKIFLLSLAENFAWKTMSFWPVVIIFSFAIYIDKFPLRSQFSFWVSVHRLVVKLQFNWVLRWILRCFSSISKSLIILCPYISIYFTVVLCCSGDVFTKVNPQKSSSSASFFWFVFRSKFWPLVCRKAFD